MTTENGSEATPKLANFADLTAGILSTEEREIPALGCSILIKEVSTGDFEKLQKIKNDDDRVVKFFCAGISDGTEKKLTHAQAKEMIEKNSFKAVKQIMSAIMSVSGVGEDNEEGES